MASGQGQRAVVVSAETDELRQQMLDDDLAPLTLDAGGTNEISIFDHNEQEIVAAAAVAVSGSLATYSRTWDTTTFPFTSTGTVSDFWGTRREWRRRIRTYKAVWTLTTTSPARSWTRVQYFELVRRRFLSQFTLTELKELYPSIDAETDDTFLQKWISEAWREIEQDAWQQFGDYPGNLFFPGNFKKCHRFKTLENIYLDISFGDQTDEDWVKHERFAELASRAYTQAVSRAQWDWDDDGVLDTDEGDFAGAVISVER